MAEHDEDLVARIGGCLANRGNPEPADGSVVEEIVQLIQASVYVDHGRVFGGHDAARAILSMLAGRGQPGREAENAELRAGADPTPPVPSTERTPGQFWYHLLELPEVERLDRLAQLLRQAGDGYLCAVMQHRSLQGEVDRLQGVHRASQGELERLRGVVAAADEFGDRHVVDFREDGWTLAHPLSCRSTGLFTCPFHAAFEDITGPAARVGKFVVALDAGRLVVGEQVHRG